MKKLIAPVLALGLGSSVALAADVICHEKITSSSGKVTTSDTTACSSETQFNTSLHDWGGFELFADMNCPENSLAVTGSYLNADRTVRFLLNGPLVRSKPLTFSSPGEISYEIYCQ